MCTYEQNRQHFSNILTIIVRFILLRDLKKLFEDNFYKVVLGIIITLTITLLILSRDEAPA